MKKIFTLIVACVATLAATAQTDGTTTSNAWGLTGEGTEANPYCINTADDLYTMAKNCNTKNKGTGEFFVLKNDIDFGGSAETPMQLPAIGKDGNAQIAAIAYGFDGTFDGAGHTISGIYHTETGNNAKGKFNGLFGCIDKNGVVKNLIISKDNHIAGYNYVGTIASLNMGLIQNCTNYADVTAANFAAGGVCGFFVNGTGIVKDCQNFGNVKAMTYASGICGGSQSGKSVASYSYLIEHCTNKGNLSTTNGLGSAGIAGSYSGAVKDCTNYGITDDTHGTSKSKQYTAGIVACASYAVDIDGCKNYGTVNGVKNVGGIVGNVMMGDAAATVIKNCVNDAAVNGQNAYVAGIVANSARKGGVVSVANCTNNGEVTTTATTDFIGNLRGNSTIALGEGNIIAAGLKTYKLDPETSTAIKGIEQNNAVVKKGKYLKNGRIVIWSNGSEYNINGTKL